MFKKVFPAFIIISSALILSYENSYSSNNKIKSDSLEGKWYTLLDSVILNINNKKFSKAITYIDTCIAITPHADFLYNIKGCCYMRKGSINDSLNNTIAITNFTKAIEINKTIAKYYNNRGWSYKLLKNYPKAIIDFEKAVEIAPDSIDYQNNVLGMRFLNNEYKLALQICDTLINKFPHCGYAYYVRGNLKRDYLHKYPEGNMDIKKGEKLKWIQGVNLIY